MEEEDFFGLAILNPLGSSLFVFVRPKKLGSAEERKDKNGQQLEHTFEELRREGSDDDDYILGFLNFIFKAGCEIGRASQILQTSNPTKKHQISPLTKVSI